MTNETLNYGLNLSMEFGKNWLTCINQLKEKLPELKKTELMHCENLCQEINDVAHNFIRENPIKNGDKISFITFFKFKSFMKTKYNWINDANLSRLYSQSCYYALK